MKRSGQPPADGKPAGAARQLPKVAVGTLHDLIELHRESPDDEAIGRELADALDSIGPVLTDEGEIFFRAADLGVRSFRLAEIRPARSVPWMRHIA